MFCNKCGNELSEQALFCNKCGNKVRKTEIDSTDESFGHIIKNISENAEDNIDAQQDYITSSKVKKPTKKINRVYHGSKIMNAQLDGGNLLDVNKCVVCNDKVGVFDYKLKDGYRICVFCTHRAENAYYDLIGYELDLDHSSVDAFYKNRRKIDSAEAIQICKEPKLLSKYMPEEMKYNRHLYKIANAVFDDDNGVLTFGNNFDLFLDLFRDSQPRACSYSSIIKYEYYENEDSVVKGGSGLGRAAIGGVLFGGAGAVVGAVTKKNSSSAKVSDMYILVTFKSSDSPEIYTQKINITESGDLINRGSGKYRKYLGIAETVIAKLDDIYMKENPEENANSNISTEQAVTSVADEIRKFKELFDEGIITEDEFNQKKKQLLGI